MRLIWGVRHRCIGFRKIVLVVVQRNLRKSRATVQETLGNDAGERRWKCHWRQWALELCKCQRFPVRVRRHSALMEGQGCKDVSVKLLRGVDGQLSGMYGRGSRFQVAVLWNGWLQNDVFAFRPATTILASGCADPITWNKLSHDKCSEFWCKLVSN